MSIASNTVFEVRATGSVTNGGGYVSGGGGTDWTQQAAPQYASTDIVTTTGSVIITSATANWGVDVVGNLIYMAGGTGSIAGAWYQIATRNSNTSLSLDRVTGIVTGTGATGNVGGAADSIGTVGLLGTAAGIQSGAIIYVKGATTISSATANVSGGVLSNALNLIIVGYATTRAQGNTDTPPVVSYGVASVTLAQSRSSWYNLSIDGNAQTTAKLAASGDTFIRCTIQRMNVATAGGLGAFIDCIATNNSAAVFTNPAYGCEAYANTATQFSSLTYVDCLSYGNTSGADGFNMTSSIVVARNCDAYGNAGAGFNFTGTVRPGTCINCHAEGNTGAGYLLPSLSGASLINCSAFGNTGVAVSGTGTINKIGFKTLTTGTVYTNAAANDFSKNNFANQGAALRAAGDPLTFPRGTTSSRRDIGAVQHADPAAGGLIVASPFLGGYNG